MKPASLALAVSLLLTPLTAHADEAPLLAEYWADSGSLPPEYAWSTEVKITNDGQLMLRYCINYATEGSDCKTRKAKVDEAHRAAILAAVRDGDLLAKPARTVDDMQVGGGSVGGRVYVDGAAVPLPSEPVKGDVARVNAVLGAIREAIPKRFLNHYFDRG